MKSFEIRRNEDGTIDEVVAQSDDGTLQFHLEQNSKGSWYFGLYGYGYPDQEYHMFNIYRKKKRVYVTSYEDAPTDAAIRRSSDPDVDYMTASKWIPPPARHLFTCGYCKPSPEWETQIEFLTHMENAHPGKTLEPEMP